MHIYVHTCVYMQAHIIQCLRISVFKQQSQICVDNREMKKTEVNLNAFRKVRSDGSDLV